MAERRCRDCGREGITTVRPVPHPGPRCVTHWRAEQRRRRDLAHERRVVAVYHLSEGDYGRLASAQGGRCALCRRATGVAKRLAVDHDHATGQVRGLVCGPCNSVLAHGRDSVEYFARIVDYLLEPPAQELL